jgi:hypothetical protein
MLNCKTSMAGRHNERLADARRVVPTNNVKHWFVSACQKSPPTLEAETRSTMKQTLITVKIQSFVLL